MRTRLPRRYVNSKCLVNGQKQIEHVNVKGIVAYGRKRKNKNKGLDKFAKSVVVSSIAKIT